VSVAKNLHAMEAQPETSQAELSTSEPSIVDLQRQMKSISGDVTELRNELRCLEEQCGERLDNTKHQLAATLQEHIWQQQQTTDKMHEVVHDLCGCLQTELRKVKEDATKNGDAVAKEIQSLQSSLRMEADARSEQLFSQLQKQLDARAADAGTLNAAWVPDTPPSATSSTAPVKHAEEAAITPRSLQKKTEMEAAVEMLEGLTSLHQLVSDLDMQARVWRQEASGLFRDLRKEWEIEALRIWEALDTHTHEVSVASEEVLDLPLKQEARQTRSLEVPMPRKGGKTVSPGSGIRALLAAGSGPPAAAPSPSWHSRGPA